MTHPSPLRVHINPTKSSSLKAPHTDSSTNVQSLALAHTDIKDDGVFFSPWKETDFRTGEKPWWN